MLQAIAEPCRIMGPCMQARQAPGAAVTAFPPHIHLIACFSPCITAATCWAALLALSPLGPPPPVQSWRGDRLKHLPEMRFVYEEEAAPEEFFVPYTWSLTVAATGGRLLSWNLCAVTLLTQLSGVEVSGDGSLEQRWSEDAYHSGELNV